MADLSQSESHQLTAHQALSQLLPSRTSGHVTETRVSYAQTGRSQADTALAKHHGHSVSSYAITQNNGTKSAAKTRQIVSYISEIHLAFDYPHTNLPTTTVLQTAVYNYLF